MQVKSNDTETITFTITDLEGKVLLTEESFNKHPTELGKDIGHGVYVLRIMKGQEVAIQRLIRK